MQMDPDFLLERIEQQKHTNRWRIIAVIVFVLLLATLLGGGNDGQAFGRHIARVRIEGLVLTEPKKIETLQELASNENVKAVLVHVNTPGGTAVGGEQYYRALKQIAQEKPVGVVMEDVAASAGYLISLGGDYIVASSGTITGSIGVLMESPNISGLSDKLGVRVNSITSGEKKNVPSMFKELSAEDEAYLEAMLNDFHDVFKETVQRERRLNKTDVEIVADGRIFSGRQALQAKLIDALGDSATVIQWFEDEQEVKANLPVVDWELDTAQEGLSGLLTRIKTAFFGSFMEENSKKLLLLWK